MSVTIREATAADVPDILRLVRALAVYEREPDAVDATEADFAAALFPETGAATTYCLIAERDGDVIGLAVWFPTFSTWTGRNGIWLEDLFVDPDHRGGGAGKALLTRLAQICVERGWTRLEWRVLAWNEPSIAFYHSLGSVSIDEWDTHRLDGPPSATSARCETRTMKTLTLGSDLVVPNVVLGLMRIQDKSDEEVRTLLATARDAGITMIDHAAVYGSEMHGCERRFAEAMRLTSSQREELVIQTKCGIVREGPYFDFSYDEIVHSAEDSLTALGTDHLDVLLLHRPDALVEPEEVARAFDELHTSGKVRAFGVSNHTPGQIELLKKHVRQPLVANQMQLSITHANLVAQGVAANMNLLDQSVSRDNGTLDYCRLHEITVQAWSPFQAQFFDGVFLGNDAYAELNEVIDRLAEQYAVEPIAIAVAWITRHPANMQVVLGTTTPERVAAAARGADVELTRPEWYDLFRAAGHTVP